MKHLTLALAALLSLTMPASAQQASDALRLDANGDGAISRAEYDAVNARRFAEVDANRDGALESNERPTGASGGPMTRAQFNSTHAAIFASLDRNGDGQISANELPDARARAR